MADKKPKRKPTFEPPPEWDALWTLKEWKIAAIRARYVKAGLDKWDNYRVSRLCHALGISILELMAIVGYDAVGVAYIQWNKNKWPMPMAIHFSRIEQCAVAAGLLTPLVPGAPMNEDDVAIVKLIGAVLKRKESPP